MTTIQYLEKAIKDDKFQLFIIGYEGYGELESMGGPHPEVNHSKLIYALNQYASRGESSKLIIQNEILKILNNYSKYIFMDMYLVIYYQITRYKTLGFLNEEIIDLANRVLNENIRDFEFERYFYAEAYAENLNNYRKYLK